MKVDQLQRLAEANDPQGLYEFGVLFVKGKSVKKDAARGMSMIKKAAAMGNTEAIGLLRDLAYTHEVEVQRQRMFDEFNMKEVKTAPSLTCVNSLGFRLVGKSHYDARTNSYETTHFMVILFVIPLIPTARYRVIKNGDSYRFLGKKGLQVQDFIPVFIIAAWILVSVYSGH